MSKVLLFHIFPINNWKEITTNLITNVPHQDIFIHVSLPQDSKLNQSDITDFLKSFAKVRSVFYSPNSSHPEVDAMSTFRNEVDFSAYQILTYMHTKGVTKPHNQKIAEWIELMRYFIIERMSHCEKIFGKGYLIYGVNKTSVSDQDLDFKGARFFYAGNFVSINLTSAMLEKIKSVPLQKEYYGLEGFWGKLCKSSLAYGAFHSRVNHYLSSFPDNYYKGKLRRMRYSAIAFCYQKYYEIVRRIKNLSSRWKSVKSLER